MNVELHNIRNYQAVPQECIAYIGKYMTSTQYQVDSERTISECILHLTTNCILEKDGKDSWIFDIDDTLLSSVPYYKKNGFGGNKPNETALEDWMSQGKGTALKHSLKLFNHLKELGVQIFLVSSRKEHLRSATVDNLVHVGFYGWKELILRLLTFAPVLPHHRPRSRLREMCSDSNNEFPFYHASEMHPFPNLHTSMNPTACRLIDFLALC
ncbi:hypothetical protein CQW23_22707 [Capsicum baccatum]|uniref:Acid phosphatase 1 n=1 Tax=Capsicum baccatum TaxID=33114 RepID=A0A2G2W1N3_CAPBA|nr:hypothetical protein CQW23_22707 [Capsicum baccatum]